MMIDIDDGGLRIVNIDDEEFCIHGITGTDYDLINTRECGVEIANYLFDREQLNENDIDIEINDFLKQIHEAIYDEVIRVLDDNGITVPYS